MWTKLDDHFYDHPKIDGLSLAAVGLFCKALTYCGKHLTDGELPARWLAGQRASYADAEGAVVELVQVGLWELADDESTYRIHDYLDWQPSRAYVLGNRSKKQAAGRKGGKASGLVRAAQSHNEAPASHVVEPRPDPTRPDKNMSPIGDSSVQEIFAYWKTTFGLNGKTKLTPERRMKIMARLEQGYSVEDVKRAVDGCAGSEYHVKHGHTDLDLICRNGSKLERFRSLPPKGVQRERRTDYDSTVIR